MRISLIVAMAENRVIGREGRLPWRLPADLRRFQRLTMGRTLVLGRKTYESIGRVLPGRRCIVLSGQPHYEVSGGLVAAGFEQALRLAAGEEEVFVAGGERVYRAAMPCAERIYLTVIEGQFAGDTFFPPLAEEEWQLASEENFPADQNNPHACRLLILDRKRRSNA